MAVFEISLDVSKASVVPKAVRARVGDSESCVIKATVTRSGTEYDLTGKGVRFECMLPDGSFVRDAGVEVDGTLEEGGVGGVADGDKESADGEVAQGAVLDVAQTHGGDGAGGGVVRRLTSTSANTASGRE